MLIMDDFLFFVFFPSSTFMYEYKNLCNLALRVFHKSILGKRRVPGVHVPSVHVMSVHVGDGSNINHYIQHLTELL